MPKAGCSLALIICPTSFHLHCPFEPHGRQRQYMAGHAWSCVVPQHHLIPQLFFILFVVLHHLSSQNRMHHDMCFSLKTPLQGAQAGPHPVSGVRGLWPPPTTQIKSCYFGLFFECADSHYKCSRHGLKDGLQQLHTESC